MDDWFAREVLRLAEGQTIESHEDQIKQQAQQLGIHLPLSLPSPTDKDKGEVKRRSVSLESRVSHSTGPTSTRISKDDHNATLSLAFGNIHDDEDDDGKSRSTTAVSIKDYDSILSHARRSSRRSHNFLPLATHSPSSFSSLPLSLSSSSLGESSPKRQIIRGLSRLRLHCRSVSSSSVKNE